MDQTLVPAAADAAAGGAGFSFTDMVLNADPIVQGVMALLALWMFDRPREPIHQWLRAKFKSKPELADANIAALDAGHAYGETAELSGPLRQVHMPPTPTDPATGRGSCGERG